MPPPHKWPRNSFQPNIAAISATASFSIARGCAPAVKRVIVGIDPHRQRIGQPRHRMRRLKHLSRIQGMKVRIVVVQPLSGCSKSLGDAREARAPSIQTQATQQTPHRASSPLPGMPLNFSVPAAPVTIMNHIATHYSLSHRILTYFLLPNFIQLPRRLQQIQLRLLPLKIRIQKSHPFFILFQPRSFHFAQIHFPLGELLCSTPIFCCASCSSSRATSFAASRSRKCRVFCRTSALTCVFLLANVACDVSRLICASPIASLVLALNSGTCTCTPALKLLLWNFLK